MPPHLHQYDVVRVIRIHNNRFLGAKVFYERLPLVGDTGTIVEVYVSPSSAFEVECVDPATGNTIWLEAMQPEEIERVEREAS